MKAKKIILATTLFAVLQAMTFAQTLSSVDKFNGYLGDFTSHLNSVIPNSAVTHNVYSDAWIGKFLPSFPPHFAVGIETGVTKLDASSLVKACEMVNITGLNENLVFPTVGVNAKIGGIILPFDLGLSFLTFDTRKSEALSKYIGYKYFVIGGNARYAIIEGNVALPKVSVGVGYYYSKGSVNKTTDYAFVDVGYATHTLSLEAQVSKKFAIVTPFVGFRGIFSKSTSDFSWHSDTGVKEVNDVLNGKGSYSTGYADNFIPQVFGGVGFTFALVQLDLNASYDFRNQIWTAGTSIRFKM